MFPWNFFPFDDNTKKMAKTMKPGEIEKYVHEMMNKMFDQQMRNMPTNNEFLKNIRPLNSASSSSKEEIREQPLNANIFETLDYVFVIIPVQKDWPEKMKLYHTSNQLIIEQIPDEDNKHTFTLPAIVRKKGTTAQLKDGLLEIKLLKDIDVNFSEINITEKP